MSPVPLSTYALSVHHLLLSQQREGMKAPESPSTFSSPWLEKDRTSMVSDKVCCAAPQFLFSSLAFELPPLSLLPLPPAQRDELFSVGPNMSTLSSSSSRCASPQSTALSTSDSQDIRGCSSEVSRGRMSTQSFDVDRMEGAMRPSPSTQTSTSTASGSSIMSPTSLQGKEMTWTEQFATTLTFRTSPSDRSFGLLHRMRGESLRGRLRPTSNSLRSRTGRAKFGAKNLSIAAIDQVQFEPDRKSQELTTIIPAYLQSAALNMIQEACDATYVFQSILDQQSSESAVFSTSSENVQWQRESLDNSATFSQGQGANSSLESSGILAKLRKRHSRHSIQLLVSKARGPVPGISNEDEDLHQDSITHFPSWGWLARHIWTDTTKSFETVSPQVDDFGTQTSDDPSHLSGNNGTRHWASFRRAYSRGEFDLSLTPKKPEGVPSFECCPNATPLETGRLDAPIPEWECFRVRTFRRLQLDRLSTQVLELIASKVSECTAALCVSQAELQCLEGDRVFTLAIDGFRQTSTKRQEALCAHVILNRNKGMTVQDVHKDWRFELAQGEECDVFSFYAGIPVLAANGVPVAVLSIWDTKPSALVDTVCLRRVAQEIGQIFETHLRELWSFKICQMALSLQEQRERLLSQTSTICRDDDGEDDTVGSAKHQSHLQRPLAAKAIHSNGWSGSYNHIELEALARLGLLLTLEDVYRLRHTLREAARQLEMDAMYVAVICLPWGSCSDEDIHVLAQHNLPVDRLSYRFHQEVFGLEVVARSEEVKRNMIFRQADSLPYHLDDQPLGGRPWAAILLLPITRRAKLGFVLGALSRSESKALGIEDLRYMEALRPILRCQLDRFQAAHRSTQIEALYDAQRKGRRLSRQTSFASTLVGRSSVSGDKVGALTSRPVTPLEHFVEDQIVAGLRPRPRTNRAKSTSTATLIENGIPMSPIRSNGRPCS